MTVGLTSSRERVSNSPAWRPVVLPREHGGWGLTLEPVLLGLLVAWSAGGLALGLAVVLVFLVRTPLELVLVDVGRRRWRPRTTRATQAALVELVLMAAMIALAVRWAGWRWWPVVVVAAPLVAIEVVYGIRSRSRRLIPEVSGAIAIAAAAPAIVLAGGGRASLAAAVWLILTARVLGSIPFVRAQVLRLRRGEVSLAVSDAAQVVAIVVAAVAVGVDRAVVAGLAGIVVVSIVQTWWPRRPSVPAVVLGVRQMVLGVALVLLVSLGVHVT